jgi:hypothetical protein
VLALLSFWPKGHVQRRAMKTMNKQFIPIRQATFLDQNYSNLYVVLQNKSKRENKTRKFNLVEVNRKTKLGALEYNVNDDNHIQHWSVSRHEILESSEEVVTVCKKQNRKRTGIAGKPKNRVNNSRQKGRLYFYFCQT